MKTKLVLILLLASTFFACKKDSSGDNSGNKYYFNYTIGSEKGGYSYTQSYLDIIPSTDWLGYGDMAGMEILGGVYPRPTFGSAYMAARDEYGVRVTLSNNCNTSDRPNCFVSDIRLDKFAPGKYTNGKGLSSFYITELSTSPNPLYVEWDEIEYADPGENITVTLTNVEPIGGLIKGEFSGKLKDERTDQLVNVSGKFAVVHTY